MARPDDATEFARIALPHLDAAYNLARWLVRDQVQAEDVVQDAMLRAMTYFSGYRGGNAKAWLLQIVRTTAYTRLAARQTTTETPIDWADALADPADDPEAVLVRRERSATLGSALAALPDELRECLVLRELEELSYRDIARITGVPLGTVMSRLWRARQSLRPPSEDNVP